jgi:hypothetical protein
VLACCQKCDPFLFFGTAVEGGHRWNVGPVQYTFFEAVAVPNDWPECGTGCWAYYIHDSNVAPLQYFVVSARV